MAFSGPYRIHVAPQGYEDERIYLPANRMDADKVILLVPDEDSEQGKECLATVLKELDELGIDTEEVSCDIFNANEALRAITKIVHQHPNDQIYVNISTGSKITAVNGTIACMLTGATPYYVKAKDYGDETVSKGVDDILNVPTYPLDLPEDQYIKILGFIESREEEGEEVLKKDLSQFAWEEGLPLVQDLNREDENNMYDIVNKDIIAPLQERRYISIQQFGNKKLVSLTDSGRDTLEISRYLLEE